MKFQIPTHELTLQPITWCWNIHQLLNMLNTYERSIACLPTSKEPPV